MIIRSPFDLLHQPLPDPLLPCPAAFRTSFLQSTTPAECWCGCTQVADLCKIQILPSDAHIQFCRFGLGHEKQRARSPVMLSARAPSSRGQGPARGKEHQPCRGAVLQYHPALQGSPEQPAWAWKPMFQEFGKLGKVVRRPGLASLNALWPGSQESPPLLFFCLEKLEGSVLEKLLAVVVVQPMGSDLLLVFPSSFPAGSTVDLCSVSPVATGVGELCGASAAGWDPGHSPLYL